MVWWKVENKKWWEVGGKPNAQPKCIETHFQQLPSDDRIVNDQFHSIYSIFCAIPNKMNLLSVLCLVISASVIYGAPAVDVNNDHRPILDVISPQDELVTKSVEIGLRRQISNWFVHFDFHCLANCWERTKHQHRNRRHSIERFNFVRSHSREICRNYSIECKFDADQTRDDFKCR